MHYEERYMHKCMLKSTFSKTFYIFHVYMNREFACMQHIHVRFGDFLLISSVLLLLLVCSLCSYTVFCSQIYLFIHTSLHSFLESHSLFALFFFYSRKSHQAIDWFAACFSLVPVYGIHTHTHTHIENDSTFLSALKSRRYFVCCARIQLILDDFTYIVQLLPLQFDFDSSFLFLLLFLLTVLHLFVLVHLHLHTQ